MHKLAVGAALAALASIDTPQTYRLTFDGAVPFDKIRLKLSDKPYVGKRKKIVDPGKKARRKRAKKSRMINQRKK